MSRTPVRDVTSRTPGPSVNAPDDGLEGAYTALLHSAPSGGLCKVTIPALDPVGWRTAFCSHSLTGSVGQGVLVIFDENKNPWIVVGP